MPLRALRDNHIRVAKNIKVKISRGVEIRIHVTCDVYIQSRPADEKHGVRQHTPQPERTRRTVAETL